MPTTPKVLQPVVIVSPYRDYLGFVIEISTITTRLRVRFYDDILCSVRECWFDRKWLKAI